MKILVICQYYYPEPFKHSDVCEELVKRGHEVTVITGIPNYPMGEIYEGYNGGKNRDEVINGVHVIRCFTVPRKTGVINRFINYYSYTLSSKRYVKKIKDRFDVVFVYQLSPVMMATAGLKYKKLHNVKLILYCLDLWPGSLFAGGIRKNGLIYKFYHKVSNNIYKQADCLLITSKSFAQYFDQEFEIKGTKYLPQYAEGVFDYKQCQKIADEYIDLMFAGNIGKAQSVKTIIEAAKIVKDKRIRWHIVGDGVEVINVKKLAEGLDNVIFYGRKPLAEMPKYYSMADAMIVTMEKNDVLNRTLPGKVQTYMAAGKPIIGAIDGETKLLIEDALCGFCGPAEDAEALANNVLKFANSHDIAKMKNNSLAYYENNFSKNKFIEKLERELVSYHR